MPYDPVVNYQPTRAEVAAVERGRRGKITRLDAYQEALRFLEQAVDALDQAHACLKDAKCDDITVLAGNPYRLDARQLTDRATNFLKAVQTATCDDCDKLLADCECPWLREAVRSCPHGRLDEDGICRSCGADRRGI